jgi:demethylmenaquinone methyltransferase/2-methoxy-6-polyprenyl-1,4-benzoquinol methylase
MPDPKAVYSMFGRIARRYDLANRVLSCGIDIHWRSRLVAAVGRSRPRNVLDLATGSGDVAFAMARGLHPSLRVFGLDFCEPMLERAEARKARRLWLYSGVDFIHGDALEIPVPEASFDAVTMAFGLRNMADRARCLSEIRRVLRPDGRLFILEFSQPLRWVRPAYYFYLRHIVPVLAGILTGDRRAYEYLGYTIGGFPDRDALSEELRKAGFGEVSSSAMTMGIVALHQALRQSAVS